MTIPKIDPKTGHEPQLPDPRPRQKIMAELLASHQVDPNTHLFDIYYRLQWILKDLQLFVDREQKEQERRWKKTAT